MKSRESPISGSFPAEGFSAFPWEPKEEQPACCGAGKQSSGELTLDGYSKEHPELKAAIEAFG